MRQKPGTKRSYGEKVVKDIRRATRKQYSAEEKIKIWLYELAFDNDILLFDPRNANFDGQLSRFNEDASKSTNTSFFG
ncbi:hypothetical protein [Ruegeria sp. Ofav3-42]|uniref:hypothetical protein n=1 Tax=Ruegeria sp. Ofav3-42 TaxID=2917759 RepID=UPI001EF56B2B|nr:hypothetical protein [Ruegeria sp. Ofav3-42]MCG7519514.1 hypothetical protein [Ruegeria sp. Ofav3-42]